MPVPTLQLNEPVRSLFAQSFPILEKWLPSVMPADTPWSIGGGTVLAAQWRHRVSTDIDICLTGRAGIAAISPQWNRGFTDEMAAQGATRVEVKTKLLTFFFPQGKVDIVAIDPAPALASMHVRIEGQSLYTLPNSCILVGKLFGRGLRMPARDLFDICVSADADPAALRCAVNHLPPQTRTEITAQITELERRYLEYAPREILEPPTRWRHLLTEGPRIAVDLLHDFAYRQVDLSYSEQGALVQVETNRGDVITERFHGGQELLTGLLGLGLEEWVLGKFGTTEALLSAAAVGLASES